MAEIFEVETRGIGKPDYSKEVSSGRQRSGLSLKYNQTLLLWGIVPTAVNTGVHTAAPHATIMTDITAHFTDSAQVGLVILNVTDGSYGIIIANTETTVAVAALIGGAANLWATGDVYSIPSPFAWVTAPLAPGAMAHYIDNITGIALPYTIPPGYTVSLISGGGSFTEDAILWVYIDGLLLMSGGVMGGGSLNYENRVVNITTATIDPTGASSHTLDVQLTNRGAGSLEGGITYSGILEDVGTPPLPLTKKIRCKWCGHEEPAPWEQTKLICPKCGRLTLVYTTKNFRATV